MWFNFLSKSFIWTTKNYALVVVLFGKGAVWHLAQTRACKQDLIGGNAVDQLIRCVGGTPWEKIVFFVIILLVSLSSPNFAFSDNKLSVNYTCFFEYDLENDKDCRHASHEMFQKNRKYIKFNYNIVDRLKKNTLAVVFGRPRLAPNSTLPVGVVEQYVAQSPDCSVVETSLNGEAVFHTLYLSDGAIDLEDCIDLGLYIHFDLGRAKDNYQEKLEDFLSEK
ncbi:MAG: hypothetical protein ABJQ71_01065 [Roseibium sp.]